MTDTFRLTLAQANPVMGDLSGNADKVRAVWQEAKAAGADMVAFPEMFIVGYNAQDLILKPALQASALAEIEQLAKDCADGPVVAVGGPLKEGEALYNAYFILRGGKIAHIQRKHNLPNYTVFDEERLFDHGPMGGPYNVNGVRVGSPVCEDAWFADVPETLEETGAEFLVVPNGSPYYRDKFDRRMSHMVARVIETGLPLVYLNMVGGQDDQVFDGGSFVLNPGGQLAVQLPVFDEVVAHVDFERTSAGWRCKDGPKAVLPAGEEQDYRVCVEALRDYMGKSGFSKVLLGLSGGIDSALVATIAVDALGAENVRCVMLPSEYTSQGSLDDAKDIAERLGVRYDYVPIVEGRDAITNTLAPLFEGLETGLAEENIQSRLRGLLLMAMSNKFGEMLLTTGNKSEVAVGYATIYGDMAGGYNPIKDMYKTRVFETSRWRNDVHRDWMMGSEGEVIPPAIIDKPPSAELRPDQKDEDSLPPYDVLDAILYMLVDEDKSVAECVAAGYDRETVKRVEHLVYISEYKRFQSAPGARLSRKAFWLDRRYPIVNRFRDPS
ncbi:NAD+ synthase [Shimia sp. R10_1]|uniref:NAD+ synthase n=1 Tax=Shimia sp. R10_1 TaxID=2821095 RepID=UPI001ADD4C69|nr:NAD+ synthase [Shimia sp. R10_1]MBO9473410.1 NAD+ synthase [Shimia sp. R10_1]